MRIHHVGICVPDVEKALDFYTRVLGFRQEETINIGGVNYYFVGDGNISIEIEPSHAPGSNSHDNGIGHIALAVDDLEVLAERLRQEKITFLVPPSRDANHQGVTNLFEVCIHLHISSPSERHYS
jgi:catechol 2,3-dioxygenase-like lactoylglutathione lyase family enzyme